MIQDLNIADNADHGRTQKTQPLEKEGRIKAKRTWATEKIKGPSKP